MHVFVGGDICLPMIKPEHYSASVTNWDIAQSAENMIHQEPNPKDPANLRL